MTYDDLQPDKIFIHNGYPNTFFLKRRSGNGIGYVRIAGSRSIFHLYRIQREDAVTVIDKRFLNRREYKP